MRNPFASRKRDGVAVFAPCAGRVVDLSEVPDPVFAGRSLGDGFAVLPDEGTIRCPVAGELVLLPASRHAFALRTAEGVEVLVHIGVDTVALRGEGFEALAEVGTQLAVGDPVVRVDLERVRPEVASLATCVLVTSGQPVTLDGEQVRDGRVATVRPER